MPGYSEQDLAFYFTVSSTQYYIPL